MLAATAHFLKMHEALKKLENDSQINQLVAGLSLVEQRSPLEELSVFWAQVRDQVQFRSVVRFEKKRKLRFQYSGKELDISAKGTRSNHLHGVTEDISLTIQTRGFTLSTYHDDQNRSSRAVFSEIKGVPYLEQLVDRKLHFDSIKAEWRKGGARTTRIDFASRLEGHDKFYRDCGFVLTWPDGRPFTKGDRLAFEGKSMSQTSGRVLDEVDLGVTWRKGASEGWPDSIEVVEP